jgi:CRP-like cAMP-binding protein
LISKDILKERALSRILELKEQFSIFSGMDNETLRNIIKDVEFMSYKKGEFVFKNGQQDKEIYIIMEGSCAVIVNGKNVATLNKKETFGEFSPITSGKRSASIVSLEQTKAIRFKLDIDYVESHMTGAAILYKNFVHELINKLEKNLNFFKDSF